MALPSLRTRKLYHPTGRQSFAMMLDCVVDLNAAKKGEYVSCPRISDGTMTFYDGSANRANLTETQALRAYLTNLQH